MKSSARKLTSVVIWSVGFGAMALTSAAPALAVCDPASTDPSCPIGQLSLTNPANPASPLNMNNPSNPSSPLNINNPANPASPFNLSNPANPASPLNPNNPASAEYLWAHSPNNPASPQYVGPGSPNPYPYYRRPTLFDLIGPQASNAPQDVELTEPYAPAPRRHHKQHRRHTHPR